MVAELDCEIEDVLDVMSYENYGRYPPNISLKVNKVVSRCGIEFCYVINTTLRYDISNEDYTNIKNSVYRSTFVSNNEKCLLLYNRTKDYIIDKFSEGYSIELYPSRVYIYAKYKDVIVRISMVYLTCGYIECSTLAIYINKVRADKQASDFYDNFGSEQEVEYYDDDNDETYYGEEFVSYNVIDADNVSEANRLIERYFGHHEEINKIVSFVIHEEEFIANFNETNRIIHSHIFPEKQAVKFRINIVNDLSEI